MENLKIKIQILDEHDTVLVSSILNKSTVDTAMNLHGVDMLTDMYNTMLEGLDTENPKNV